MKHSGFKTLSALYLVVIVLKIMDVLTIPWTVILLPVFAFAGFITISLFLMIVILSNEKEEKPNENGEQQQR